MNEQDSGFQSPELRSNLPEADLPTFYEIERNAEAGIAQRGLARYLITKNYERSIRWHRRLGSPIVRKLVMGTAGRIFPHGSGGNYRLDDTKSKIEAATNFAFRGSVVNETLHTALVVPSVLIMAQQVTEGKYGAGAFINTVALGTNLSLVALQRYNRARMIKRVDEELQSGVTFRPGYRNYLGIDYRAVRNYESNLALSNEVDEISSSAANVSSGDLSSTTA